MSQSDILLAVGENVQIGNQLLTVVDIEADEIIFRVDSIPPKTDLKSTMDDYPQKPR